MLRLHVQLVDALPAAMQLRHCRRIFNSDSDPVPNIGMKDNFQSLSQCSRRIVATVVWNTSLVNYCLSTCAYWLLKNCFEVSLLPQWNPALFSAGTPLCDM